MRITEYTGGGDSLTDVFLAVLGPGYLVPVTFVLSLLLPIAVRPLLRRLGVMDVPNERSSHERPVLRGLGLAVLIAMLLGSALGLWLLVEWEGGPGQWQTFLVLALTPGAVVSGIALPVLILLAVYAVLFVSSYINVANFMDGLNGISGFHGVIAGASFAAAGLLAVQPWLVFAGVVLMAGFAGFLPWNFVKPGAFLGDVGSYLLGGAIAITSFAALVSGVPLLATIGPMVIYFGDVGVTLVKRVRAGYQWDEPHKEHVYQRLQQRGLSHAAASGVTAIFTVATSLLGLASFAVSPPWWFALLVAGIALVVLYCLLPRLLGAPRSERAPR